MPLRFMGKLINSNNCRLVTDHTFGAEIGQRCTFDGESEITYQMLIYIYIYGNSYLRQSPIF